MANKPSLLARIGLRAKQNPVVTQLFTHAIGQPLLVHPSMGESLIGAYLAGAVDANGPLIEQFTDEPAMVAEGQFVNASTGEPVKSITVLNISGGLVNRPAPGLCDPGPLSYETIGNAIDEAAADDSVKAIVLRMASPGGMASGCFDLADRIFEARQKKPIYAMVDDFAYSAAYAIAAAADEIWVTRTGGVGSVGVVCWHMEQSKYNEKVGLTVTPIFAGARKVDYSQHMPLSKEAFDDAQAHVDTLRNLFVDSVAKYRGMDADAVRATEAGTFNGAAAVAAGMADRVGTFRDLMAHIEAPKTEDEATASATSDAPAAAANDAGAELAADGIDVAALEEFVDGADASTVSVDAATTQSLTDLLAQSRLATDLVGAIVLANPKMEELAARIEHAQKVADLCTAAGLREAAADYVRNNIDIEQVRRELTGAVADAGPNLSTLPTREGGAAASGHWGTTIKRFGGS